jgi:hypothetical protein
MSYENTKTVTLMFAGEKEVEEGFFMRIFRSLFRLKTPTEIIEIPVEVICGYEEKGDTVRLWMTNDEARPLIDMGFPMRMALIDPAIFNGRGIIADLPKEAIYDVTAAIYDVTAAI